MNPSSSSSSSVTPSSVRPVPRYHHLDGNGHEGILLRPENIIGEESLEDVIQQSLAHLAPPVDDADEPQTQSQEGQQHAGQVTVEPSIAVHDDTLDQDLFGEISRSSLPKVEKLPASQASRSPTPGFTYEQDDSSSIVLISRPSSSQATTADLLEPAAQIQGPSLFRRTIRTSTIHFNRSDISTLPYPRLLDTFGVAMLLRTQPAAREEWSDENNQSGVKDPWKDARMRLSVLCVSIWLSFILALPLLCSAIVKGNDAEPSLGAFVCMILSISLTGELCLHADCGISDRSTRQALSWLYKSSFPKDSPSWYPSG
ncbi:hypothetical protein FA10DRAFT_90738 [Acaromyces ingoldii]|uniref:Uncharacterized protein n=1 Tax=Acaromyces ingoldii TaxID=215250 RepID=A0A316YTA2_9BASI|nr:hypothetical protein FA10DRAFT_90738 [Acaromyces ingoldii]PWN92352.1 hypothetical protein FA10DRAFT_90738 [Acaromyces ingoldii]